MTRLLTAIAVLAGLFLMHGAPAMPACHGGEVMAAAPVEAPMEAAVHHAGLGADMASAMATSPTASRISERHGDSCVSVPPDDTQPFAADATPASHVQDIPHLGPTIEAAFSSRAPPIAGAELLTRVGISRT